MSLLKNYNEDINEKLWILIAFKLAIEKNNDGNCYVQLGIILLLDDMNSSNQNDNQNKNKCIFSRINLLILIKAHCSILLSTSYHSSISISLWCLKNPE